ncbi:hypothetical protein LR013_00305 [candidate division NPL-UPA2 bacterium]|nr:hypothetical protein [candidate division NPL-UPA2 bacterium]
MKFLDFKIVPESDGGLVKAKNLAGKLLTGRELSTRRRQHKKKKIAPKKNMKIELSILS